jgi:hypothetical protein
VSRGVSQGPTQFHGNGHGTDVRILAWAHNIALQLTKARSSGRCTHRVTSCRSARASLMGPSQLNAAFAGRHRILVGRREA